MRYLEKPISSRKTTTFKLIERDARVENRQIWSHTTQTMIILETNYTLVRHVVQQVRTLKKMSQGKVL